VSKLVSILVPLFNSEKYIAETITSALSQTWNDIEVIIVDDGSTDKSYSIAKSYESDKLKVFRQEHKGACAARNLAFEKSTGDYIQYLDSDDIMACDKIEKQISYFEEFGNNIITSSKSVIFSSDINESYEHGKLVCKDYSNPLDYMIDTWENGNYLGIHAWLFPRGIVKNAGYWDNSLKRYQDGEFLVRILYLIDKIKFVPNTTVFYRDRLNSITNLNFHESELSYCMALSAIIKKIVIPSNYERALNASVAKISSSIYRWYPYFPDLVDKGFEMLKMMDSKIVLKRKDFFWTNLYHFLGWQRTRNIELKYEIVRDKIVG